MARLTKLAKKYRLQTVLYPQLVGAEELLGGGETTFDSTWWDQWLDEIEKFNLYNARVAASVGIDILKFQNRQPGMNMEAEYEPIYNARMEQMIVKIRQLYAGKIMADAEPQATLTYWHSADFVSEKVLDPLPTDHTTSLDEARRILGDHLDNRYKWIHDQSGKPFIVHQFNAGGALGPLESKAGKNQTTREAINQHWQKQKIYHQAFFQAVNERPWMAGVYLFAYGFTDAPDSLDASLRGKPAEVISSAWAKKITATRK